MSLDWGLLITAGVIYLNVFYICPILYILYLPLVVCAQYKIKNDFKPTKLPVQVAERWRPE